MQSRSSLTQARANALKSISTSERSHVGRNWQHELDFDLGEVAPYVTCDLSEVEMNVESDILPTLDLSEVPKNFDAFALDPGTQNIQPRVTFALWRNSLEFFSVKIYQFPF